VVDAYRMAKKEMGDIQLALIGAMTAKDDYDAFEVLAELQRYTDNDPDIHIYYDPSIIKDRQVNAFQTGSDIVLQKSLREGFGLTVTEAMWKTRPVIGGNCGGIKLQIIDGETGYLVNDVTACADRIVTLLSDQQLVQSMGAAAKEAVRKNHLMPRLLLDYLNLATMLMEKQGVASAADGSITLAS
jgi:trehalose synthase